MSVNSSPPTRATKAAISRNLEPARDRAQKLVADDVAETSLASLKWSRSIAQHGKGLAADLGVLEGLRQAWLSAMRFGRSVSAS